MYSFFLVTKTALFSLYVMKVVLPIDTEQSINFIPRVYPTGAISFYLKNEATKTETLVSNSYVISDGVITLTFTFDFSERDKYQIRILEGTDIIYRGKLFATEQTPQDFSLIEGFISY